jgi:hypothetical protein
MMEPTDLTIELLKSIRDEVSGVRGEVHALRGEVVTLHGEVAGVREQQVRSEIRVATELATAIGELRGLRDDLRVAALCVLG